ncbi:MAG: Cof-type HAD-IIB family hydrolase [Synergistaceae bacterium]|jgi:Cof subfamily protein (haloacid dehalogenase superfamily)|nr:Cof-type HAD-IIB family hydrolase [Synergistaceae bacterium]
MTPVKLIATDLDGTLLDSSGKIPKRNMETIEEAMARGIAVTLCTGRMFSSAKSFAEQAGIKIPFVCYNGAMTIRPDGEQIWHLPLDMDIALELLESLRPRNLHVQSYIGDVLYVKSADAGLFQEYVKYFGIIGKVIGDDVYAPKVPPTKLLIMTDTAEEAAPLADELRGRFGEKLYVTRSNSNFVETMNPNANKANGLARVAEILGVKMDEVMAIGDGENDAEMVARAGVGVAMENGEDKIKQAAKHIAPPNDEYGFSWAVGKFALNKQGQGD